MYQQNTPNNNAAVWRLVIPVILALALGLALANLPHQIADARGTDAATDYQRQIDQLELQKQAARKEADIKAIQMQKELREQQQQLALERQTQLNALDVELQAQLNMEALAYRQVANAQELAAKDREARLMEALKVGLTVLLGLSLLIAISALSVSLVRRNNRTAAPVADPWQSLDVRLAARERARANESLTRQLAGLTQATTSVAKSPNGRKWSDLPLVVPGDDSLKHPTPNADDSNQDQG